MIAAGADRRLVADLAIWAWCDLVVLAAAEGEDTSCLLAGPLANEEAFGGLLTWAVTGQPPTRYRACARPQPLLPAASPELVRDLTLILNGRRREPADDSPVPG